MVLEGDDQDARLAYMPGWPGWHACCSNQDQVINPESLAEKETVAPSQVMLYLIILADAETTNVRLDCVAGMCYFRKRITKYNILVKN